MGKIIRAVRQTREHKVPTNIYKRGVVALPRIEKAGTGTVTEILHEPGRSAPLCRVTIKHQDTVHKGLFVAPEGIAVGQTVEFGEDASYKLGNCLPIRCVSEGSHVSCVEKIPFDGGRYAKSSGCYVTVTQQNRDSNTTTLTLRSGARVVVPGDARCVVGIVAGGGKLDKPLLKAVNAKYKNKYKRSKWPVVRGVAMNPVDHPHGGGNFQHIGQPSTVSKHNAPNARVGLVGARRTGRSKGTSKNK